jgi:EAL domain-containing protein (putative c-di-GMP-specific phosphodiesterase class I)
MSSTPLAERAGLIRRLGRVVLEAACHDLAEWHRRFPSRAGLGVAVNLTARQVGGIDLVGDIRGALGRSGLSPTLLTLELAESVLSGADHGATTALNLLQVDGVKISIDDFGTGYASLRYLAQLPVASVKVDQSFTAGLPVDRTSVTMVRAVAALARDLGIACVVEGIETAAQLQALPKGVQGQGFWLGRPMTAARLTGLLEGCGLKQLEAPIGGLTACRSVRANRRSSEPAAS